MTLGFGQLVAVLALEPRPPLPGLPLRCRGCPFAVVAARRVLVSVLCCDSGLCASTPEHPDFWVFFQCRIFYNLP